MRQIVLFSCCAVLLAFALPLLLCAPGQRQGEAAEPVESAAPETDAPSVTAPAASSGAETDAARDAQIRLRLRTDAGCAEISMAEYLPLALAGEMPASFSPEALKAQAVALRTYALYYRAQRKSAHPDADVCGDPGCCAALAQPEGLQAAWGARYAEYSEKIREAVQATDGQILIWEDAPALTVFHASSAIRTENGAALGVAKDYLVSVDTPETEQAVRNLITAVEVAAEEFAVSVHSVAPEADLSGPPERWIGTVRLDEAGRVASVEIGGAELSALALRQLFSLRSTDFTLLWSEGRFVFRVRGYGHGLGMSQYGAETMARLGSDYAAILSHYYPGTALSFAGQN